MLKPDDIPDEVADAIRHCFHTRGAAKVEIAAAINAWPGMGRFEDETGWDVHIELPLLIPLPQEKSDAED